MCTSHSDKTGTFRKISIEKWFAASRLEPKNPHNMYSQGTSVFGTAVHEHYFMYILYDSSHLTLIT